jgi:DNA-binding NtrC family response regulator
LTERGYFVSEAGDARTALQTIQESTDPFDVILLDYRLPDSNDLALLSKIRFLAPTTQVIMVTAHGSPELAEKATALGAYAMVSKPFEVESLAALVGRARVAGLANGH